jgi:hypothetical protein
VRGARKALSRGNDSDGENVTTTGEIDEGVFVTTTLPLDTRLSLSLSISLRFSVCASPHRAVRRRPRLLVRAAPGTGRAIVPMRPVVPAPAPPRMRVLAPLPAPPPRRAPAAPVRQPPARPFRPGHPRLLAAATAAAADAVCSLWFRRFIAILLVIYIAESSRTNARTRAHTTCTFDIGLFVIM